MEKVEREGHSDVKYTLMDYFDDWGMNIAHLLAGLFAGVAAMREKRHRKKPFWEKVIVVLIAMIMANYLTPVVVSWINASSTIENGIAFIIGYSGLEILDLAIEVFKSKLNKLK